jgi:hypothetical protein
MTTDAQAAKRWEAFCRLHADLDLLRIEKVQQYFKGRGSKAWVTKADRSGRARDAWFWWANVQEGSVVAVSVTEGWGPHTQRDDVLYIGSEIPKRNGIYATLDAGTVKRAQRYQERQTNPRPEPGALVRPVPVLVGSQESTQGTYHRDDWRPARRYDRRPAVAVLAVAVGLVIIAIIGGSHDYSAPGPPAPSPSVTERVEPPRWDGIWLRNYWLSPGDCSAPHSFWVVQPGSGDMSELKAGCFRDNWIENLKSKGHTFSWSTEVVFAVWDRDRIMSEYHKHGDLQMLGLDQSCLTRAGIANFHDGPIDNDCPGRLRLTPPRCVPA